MRLKTFFPVGKRFNCNVVLRELGRNKYEVKCDCGNIRIVKGSSTALKKVKRCRKCFKQHKYTRKKPARTNKVAMRFNDEHYDTLYQLANKGCYRSIPEMCCQIVLSRLNNVL